MKTITLLDGTQATLADPNSTDPDAVVYTPGPFGFNLLAARRAVETANAIANARKA